MKKQQCIGTLSLSLFSTLALAHPGHALNSVYAGFIHPFLGWDHLLMMLAVGVWASQLSGKQRWVLPVTFVSVMAIGAMIGLSGMLLTGLETMLASSLILMGVLLSMQIALSTTVRVFIVALFAALHGMAHGGELAMMQGYEVVMGMLIATAILHGMGFMIGLQRHQLLRRANMMLPYLMIMVGGLFMLA